MNGRFWKDLSILNLIALVSLLLMVFSYTSEAVQITSNLNSIRQKAMMNVDVSHLRDTVQHLENYGNRSTWEKQWDAARWLEQKLKEYRLDVAVQSYEFRQTMAERHCANKGP